MQRMSRANKNCEQFKRRLAALSLLLCLVIASLSATIFNIIRAYHDCIAESCLPCAQIYFAQKLLERIGKVAAVILIVAVGLFATISALPKLDSLFIPYHSNLVSAKIRLNN